MVHGPQGSCLLCVVTVTHETVIIKGRGSGGRPNNIRAAGTLGVQRAEKKVTQRVAVRSVPLGGWSRHSPSTEKTTLSIPLPHSCTNLHTCKVPPTGHDTQDEGRRVALEDESGSVGDTDGVGSTYRSYNRLCSVADRGCTVYHSVQWGGGPPGCSRRSDVQALLAHQEHAADEDHELELESGSSCRAEGKCAGDADGGGQGRGAAALPGGLFQQAEQIQRQLWRRNAGDAGTTSSRCKGGISVKWYITRTNYDAKVAKFFKFAICASYRKFAKKKSNSPVRTFAVEETIKCKNCAKATVQQENEDNAVNDGDTKK
ncbi:hypothetical protein C8J57DRAFT_1240307 [Mycena rebaudengoi]|nr:hypothetical protein C8J57DRAFT_1240307 [Mycena rebaudengoi]